VTLLELAAQAVDGLPPVGRWAFRPGLNALVGPPPSAEGVLRSLLALLFPEAVAFPGSPGARAGVTFLGADGGTYRLVGGVGIEVVLSKLDVATNKFVSMQAEGGIARVLRGLGLPERRLFEPLFWFAPPPPPAPSPDSRTDQIVEFSPEAPTGSGSGRGIESKLSALMTTGEGDRPKPRGLRELRQRLAEVEVEERTATELEQLQFQLDGMQQKLFQIEDTLKGVERLRADQDKASRELSLLPLVTEEAVKQVQRLPQLIQKRDDTLKRITDERASLEADGVSDPSLASLGQDRMFVGAVTIGAGSVAAAVIGSSFTPELRLLALLDIPGFGLAVLRACQHISQIRKQQGVGRQLSLLTDRESRTNKAFDSESRDAKALMKQLGVETVGELEERLAVRKSLMDRQQECADKLAAAERDENVQSALASRDQLRQQVTEQEAKLSGFGGYRRDAGEVRSELEELHVEIARLGGAAPDDIHLVDDSRPPPDAMAALLRPAGELFGMTPAMLLQTIKDRAAQYISVLSDRRYSTPAYGPDGGVTLARVGAEPIPMSQVPPEDQDPCLWSLRLALAERYLSNHKLFMVVDERIAGEDGARRQLLVRLLQGISRAAQVLWLGNAVGSAANHTVQLG
jgi:hypothetical protein